MKSFFVLVAFSILAAGCNKEAPEQAKNKPTKQSSNASSDNDEALKKVYGNLSDSRLK